MAARLTDKQKKKIIADYVELGSYNGVARKYNIAPSTVKRLCDKDDKTKQKAIQKKKENTAEILAYMDTKKDVVCAIIGDYLEALRDEDKIAKATTVQLSTTLGTLIDKFAPRDKYGNAEYNNREDDPITKTLKEEFKDGPL